MTRLEAVARQSTRERQAVIIVVSALAIAFAFPALGQTEQPARDDVVIQTVASGSAAAARETYRSRVRNEMAEWRRKMQTFDQKVETGGERRLDATEVRLRAAWDETEVEARNVESATGQGWGRAKAAYETASRRMAGAWEKVRS